MEIVKKNGREYEIYRPGQDITVGHGVWLLVRYIRRQDKLRCISPDAPIEWMDDAQDIIDELLKKERER